MLENVRVLDLTRVLAGPLCTMILGDLGADVIKVERPGTGDETRGWGPPFDAEGRSAYYLSINRNKLAIAADFDIAADRDLLEGLIAESDVVVDNFRVGTLERRGVSPAEWCRRRPELTWCTITGFGADATRPGYDFVTQAECGWMAITGEPDGDPMKIGVAVADVLAGKDAAIAILASLFRREREGKGDRIITSLVDSARAALVNVAQKRVAHGQGREALGQCASESRSISDVQSRRSPDCYRCGDGRTVGCMRSCTRTIGARRGSRVGE
jgi:crotonobetainyl-CoA:carnitine CoA-transferase CaiB-like acyl-CoA transferase